MGKAQSTSNYLFDHFISGSVKMKSGAIENATLNYNVEDQSIVFQQNGQNLTLTNLDDIDTVYIEGKKFIPALDKFYEVLNPSKIGLFALYIGKLKPMEATTDHNGTSKQLSNAVSNTASNVYVSRNYKGNYDLKVETHYWLRRGNSFYKGDTEKQIAKVFPKKSEIIPTFIEENHIDLTQPSDMIKLIEFCNQR
jgi:hypothetical protein